MGKTHQLQSIPHATEGTEGRPTVSSRKASWCPGPGSAWEASRCRRKGGWLCWAPVPPAILPSTQGCILSPALSSVSHQQSRLGSPGKAGAAPGLGGTYTLPGHSPSPWGGAELTSGSAPDAPCLAQTAKLVEGWLAEQVPGQLPRAPRGTATVGW